jgi:hypothetical protein|tara:strand:+ start:163 stop:714 length:552 start_codon:yes stop_codon:yes gene_type:complete
MAEAFSNSITRAAGAVTTKSGSTIGAASTEITVTAATGIGVSDLIDNQNFIAGTRVAQISGTTVYADRNSTNSASASTQTVKFLGPTTAYTSPAATKSIIIGGTFANNTNSSVNLTLEVLDTSVGVTSTGAVSIASKIPVPAGSSFVISDTGKTLLESTDELRIYCDVDNAIDASLSILTGVN